MSDGPDYSQWSTSRLIARVEDLERQLRDQTASAKSQLTENHGEGRWKKTKKEGRKATFDPTRYSTRYIALKFAYLGQKYNGLEHHLNNDTPLPTVEEVLWKALVKTRLIFPPATSVAEGKVDWEGCEYSKCGRTDKGVSAFGQVVALRVRSARPLPRPKQEAASEEETDVTDSDDATEDVRTQFDPVRDELPYLQILNRVLPDDIRALAWCPELPSNFSARFSCSERRYRYFFTNPAYAPIPGEDGSKVTHAEAQPRDGWLDIDAMRDAAGRLEGEHDFRNFCKIDPAKQITNYRREIYHAGIREVESFSSPVGNAQENKEALRSNGSPQVFETPKLYTFDVNGSAFLWHQVRNMVAVLFLVGQGLEPASVVSDLLDVEKNPTRPAYMMASDAPLVLWDCVFPDLRWIHIGDEGGRDTNKQADLDGGDGKFGRNGIMDSLWSVWRQRKIDEILAGSLLDLVASQGRSRALPLRPDSGGRRSQRVFDGSNEPRSVGPYVDIMRKDRLAHFEEMNARFRLRKGLPERLFAQNVDADE